jgi:hypothetical protein
MYRSIGRVVVAFVMVLWMGDVRGQDGEEGKKQAIKVAAQFVQAVKAKDIEAAMKAADAPFWLEEKRVLKTRDELKAYFKANFDELQPVAKIGLQAGPAAEYKVFRKLLTKEERQQGDIVFQENDFLVSVASNDPDGTGALWVRIRNGKAAVVGGKTITKAAATKVKKR